MPVRQSHAPCAFRVDAGAVRRREALQGRLTGHKAEGRSKQIVKNK